MGLDVVIEKAAWRFAKVRIVTSLRMRPPIGHWGDEGATCFSRIGASGVEDLEGSEGLWDVRRGFKKVEVVSQGCQRT